mgnify:CR=1 FL=1
MAQFIITYLGGNPPATPQEGKQHFAKYKAWLEALADKVVSPANPFKDTHTISSDGSVKPVSSTHMSGYTVIQADTMEQALELAKGCPFLEVGGTLEVSELVQMKM